MAALCYKLVTSFFSRSAVDYVQSDGFKPHHIFKNPYLQLVMTDLYSTNANVDYEEELIKSHDGINLLLHWKRKNHKKLLVVVPGIAGASDANYIKRFVNEASETHDVLVYNRRGFHPKSPPIYSFHTKQFFPRYHNCEDLYCIINHVKACHRYDVINAIGFSAGSNLVIKYACCFPNTFNKIVSISNGFDIHATEQHLSNNKPVTYFLLQPQKNIIRRCWKDLHCINISNGFHRDFNEILNAKTIHEFDTSVHGFDNNEQLVHYYHQASCISDLNKLDTDTLLLNSMDDPIIPCCVYDKVRDAIKENKKITFICTKHGGHISWFYFNQEKKRIANWSYEVALDFLN